MQAATATAAAAVVDPPHDQSPAQNISSHPQFFPASPSLTPMQQSPSSFQSKRVYLDNYALFEDSEVIVQRQYTEIILHLQARVEELTTIENENASLVLNLRGVQEHNNAGDNNNRDERAFIF